MTRLSGPHLSADEIDAWLSGTLAPEWQQHLDRCHACLELARAEREIVDQVSALPLLSPTTEFAERVMAAVVVPDPFAIRSLQATQRRLFATPKSVALAASLALPLLGSMAGSIIWSLGHQEALASIGGWLVSQGGQVAWLSVRGVASNVIEQPWYDGIRALVDNPVRLALGSALASLAYLVGVFALRRLLAVPVQQVAHAGI
jgi:hypothetical protein